MTARAPLLLLAIAAAGGCRAADRDASTDSARLGSVGVGSSAELERLVETRKSGVVAEVLPPLEAGRPDRVVLAMQTTAPPYSARRALVEVERYPETVEQVSGIEIRERTAEQLVFEVELELPFQNLFYTLEYDLREPARVDVRGVGGALAGGRWCWEFVELDSGCLVIYTSESDLDESAGFVLQRLMAMHPDLQEGMAFAQGLRFLRAVCRQAEVLAGASSR